MAKTKEEVIQTLVDASKDAITESKVKEGYLWSRYLHFTEKNNEKVANEFKMKFAAQKRDREETFETWLDYLEDEQSKLHGKE
jgi:hypothetical protein